MSGIDFYAIIAENIDETQRALMHHSIKEVTEDWWHQQLNLWLVRGGHSASWWRERLGVFVPLAPSSILILRMPSEGQRSWSARGPINEFTWLGVNYATPKGLPPTTSEADQLALQARLRKQIGDDRAERR